ncbi:hypothetical protein CTI14_62470, partial [Methylobacterium radiotolerans]
GTLATGMGFFVKYSLGLDGGLNITVLLATAFVTAGVFLWPWRQLVARRFGARTTLLLAFALCGTLATGMGFFVKYSLGLDGGLNITVLLATAFVT